MNTLLNLQGPPGSQHLQSHLTEADLLALNPDLFFPGISQAAMPGNLGLRSQG